MLVVRVNHLLDHRLHAWITICGNPHALEQVGDLVDQAVISGAGRLHAAAGLTLAIIKDHQLAFPSRPPCPSFLRFRFWHSCHLFPPFFQPFFPDVGLLE